MTRRGIALACGAAVLAALAIAVFRAGSDAASRAGGPAGGAPAARASKDGVSAHAHVLALHGARRLADVIAAFRRPERRSDVVPPALVRSGLLADGAADPALARRAGGVSPAWLLPRTDGRSACLLTTRSLQCASLGQLRAHRLAVGVSFSVHRVVVSGIAVDGLRGVEVLAPDGTHVAVPVIGNLLHYETTVLPAAIRWAGTAGPMTFRVRRVAMAR